MKWSQELSKRMALIAVLVAAGATAQAAEARKGAVEFNRDIRPLLSEYCTACHGPDTAARKADMRLDTKAGLFKETKSEGPVVKPGNPKDSALWQRMITTDEDDVMPPKKSNKVMKPEEKELIRQWILEGAKWQDHWAFIAPERPEAPKVKNTKWVKNPIDAFVLAKLDEKGLKPADEADKRTLARRVTLDLTGLPPTPDEVEAFVKDKSKDAYEKLVARLLESPAYGEHRARYWLDAARYADTHGLHFDNYREMWPYRDWVIKAFNQNMPFDQFTIEQIAGDLLENPTQDQQVATGFHRCNMTTNEGGTIVEENLANYANDRVSTTSWVWLGLTANCAACHDHKFDPVTMKDFYAMAAFFRNTQQGGLDGNVKDSNPSITVIDDAKDYARWQELPKAIEAAKKNVEAKRKEAEPQFAKWVGGLKAEDIQRELSAKDIAFQADLDDGNTNEVTAVVLGKEQKFQPKGSLELAPEGRPTRGIALKKGVTVEFPQAGDFDHKQAFSYGAWVFIPKDYNETAAIFSRMDEKDNYRGWDLWIQQGQFATHIVSQWPDNAIKLKTSKRVAKKGRWQHLFVSYDGSGKPEGIKIFVDGEAQALETENGKGITGSIRTKVPFKLAQRSGGAHLDGLGLQDVRLYARELNPAEVSALANFSTLQKLLATPVEKWKPEQKKPIFDYYLATKSEPFKAAQMAQANLEKEREGIRLKYPVTHVQMEKKDMMPVANILFRGQYDQPRDKVEAAPFGFLNALPEGAPKNRLGLAKWLVAKENPLTARVTVNRFWQELFGTGLVKTTEDLGVVGELPVNQELLDWLAVEFRESGWDVKKLFTLMVTSSAYRQSAETTPLKLERDPANRYLSRGPRFRMDAEMVRDYALATSGLLAKKVGGPSVKPYQPPGVWEAVAMPESNTRNYKRDTGEALYRRSMYTFWKRAAPPATMDVFNAPSREVSCTRRERTNTPLQALATMNDPQFVEAARKLAEAALQAHPGNVNEAVALMAERVLARPLASKERSVVRETLREAQEYYTGKPDEAKKLVTFGESKPDAALDATKVAALTMVANQLMNLDEVLNK
jgi:mono/diheme cytochrome c family protein